MATAIIRGTEFHYWLDRAGVHVDMTGHKLNMAAYEQSRHSQGRNKYDTPASVIGCACVSCNAARKQYGKKPLPGYRPVVVHNYGVLSNGMTPDQVERAIEKQLSEKNKIN
jgi:hypothetical protein